MDRYHPFEFLFLLLLFSGIFGLCLYALFRILVGDKPSKSRSEDHFGQPVPPPAGPDFWGLVAVAFLLWLFGSLFFGMLGFDTGFH